jgi:uncharacterized membrane protein YagU involved in acid resistance
MNRFQELKPVQPLQPRRQGGSQAHVSKERTGDSLDDNATVATAQRISKKILHHDLTPAEKRVAGSAVHYGYGSLVGGLFGGLAELLPIVSVGLGMPFGFALWLLGDEIAVPVLGLGKSAGETPPEVHADALSAHFMYGATTDLLRRFLRHVL